MRQLSVTLALAAVVVAGCGTTQPSPGNAASQSSPREELLIFVGAGIRPPVAEVAEIFGRENGVDVVPDYAGSEMLFSKIKLSQAGDVYMPGDKHYIDQAAEAGMILSHRSVCYFVPTILVQKGNPKGIAGLADLVRPGIKLGLGDAQACAIGRKTKKIFQKNHIPWEQVEKNLKFQSMTVNELGMQIQAKSLDAVIVWDAIAAYYAPAADMVPIPKDQNVISTVEAGVLKFTKHRELAERFIELACSERGRAIFRKHGYRIDPPE